MQLAGRYERPMVYFRWESDSKQFLSGLLLRCEVANLVTSGDENLVLMNHGSCKTCVLCNSQCLHVISGDDM